MNDPPQKGLTSIPRMDRQQRRRWIFTGINVIAIAVMLYATSRFAQTAPKQVAYSEFLAELRADNLTDVQITERELTGVRKRDPARQTPAQELTIKATRLPGVDESLLLKELEAHPVKFGGHIDQGSWVWSLTRMAVSATVHCLDLWRRNAAHRPGKRPSYIRKKSGKDS